MTIRALPTGFRGFLSLLLPLLLTVVITVAPVPASAAKLKHTVRAANCINNSTHCHCSLKQASSSTCLKPIVNESGRCTMGNCAAGFHCDCNANDICEMVSTVYYSAADKSTDIFDCSSELVSVPRVIVGKTTDFQVIAYQEFQIFVNTEQIGYGKASIFKEFTSEVRSGDVIAVIARRLSADVYGVKLKFIDLQEEIRFIDENWFSSDQYDSSWLDAKFDPAATGWTRPSITNTITDAAFDADVPWMWFGTSETVYFRYTIP